MRDLLIDLLDLKSIVAYRPQFARALGSATAALFLSQAIYWQQKVGEGNYFYKKRDAERDDHNLMLEPKTNDQQSWEWELGLSRYEQESCRKLLKKHQLLREKLEGMPAKIYYCVDYDALVTFLQVNLAATSKKQTTDNNQPLSDHQPAGGKTTNQQDEKPLTSRMQAVQQAGGNTPNRLAGKPPTVYKETKTTAEITTNIEPPLLESFDENTSVELFKKPVDAENIQIQNSSGSHLDKNHHLNQGQLVALQKAATLQVLADRLVIPKCVNDLQRMQVLQMLHSLHDTELAQMVLDELAGAVARGNIKMPTKLLAKLITEALNGVFIPDAAIAIKQSRDRAHANAKALAKNHVQALCKAQSKSVTVKPVPAISLRQVLENLNQQGERHSHVS
ncbi:MAG TPA: hypothetical protein PL131_08160 [Methylotenera sp.]|nr:hypothetical protein [Methylotenera sp.]HPN01016.1 hypothetical protein [Methylotenera sp.]